MSIWVHSLMLDNQITNAETVRDTGWSKAMTPVSFNLQIVAWYKLKFMFHLKPCFYRSIIKAEVPPRPQSTTVASPRNKSVTPKSPTSTSPYAKDQRPPPKPTPRAFATPPPAPEVKVVSICFLFV